MRGQVTRYEGMSLVETYRDETAGAAAERAFGAGTLIRPATWGPPEGEGWKLVGYVRVRWGDPLIEAYRRKP